MEPVHGGKYLLVDGHHRFLAWKTIQSTAPADRIVQQIPVQILPNGISESDLTMISIALNLKNEQFLEMNIASMCKAVYNLTKANVSVPEIAAGFGNAKVTPSQIAFYKMVHKYVFFSH